MSERFKRTIEKIVIHHMGDGIPPIRPIATRWNPYNYEFPEYDYGIESNGRVLIGRPLDVIGAHCQADRDKYNYGQNWWNQHSIGIGLAGDFTVYTMSKVQFYSLVVLVKKLMTKYGLTLDDVYPHGQVASTDCPGCVYSKVTALKGLWDYDEFERAVLL